MVQKLENTASLVHLMSKAYEMKDFIFLNIFLKIWLDDIISRIVIFAHLTKTKAQLKNMNSSIA